MAQKNTNQAEPSAASLESAGSALPQEAPDTLPGGVTAVQVTQYKVGPYKYTSLDDALAEHRRQNAK